MSKKMIMVITFLLTVCFLILGVALKNSADRHKGINVSLGVMVDGQYVETSSGVMGENNQKHEITNTSGNFFYALAGITGIICIVTAISRKNKSIDSTYY